MPASRMQPVFIVIAQFVMRGLHQISSSDLKVRTQRNSGNTLEFICNIEIYSFALQCPEAYGFF